MRAGFNAVHGDVTLGIDHARLVGSPGQRLAAPVRRADTRRRRQRPGGSAETSLAREPSASLLRDHPRSVRLDRDDQPRPHRATLQGPNQGSADAARATAAPSPRQGPASPDRPRPRRPGRRPRSLGAPPPSASSSTRSSPDGTGGRGPAGCLVRGWDRRCGQPPRTDAHCRWRTTRRRDGAKGQLAVLLRVAADDPVRHAGPQRFRHERVEEGPAVVRWPGSSAHPLPSPCSMNRRTG